MRGTIRQTFGYAALSSPPRADLTLAPPVFPGSRSAYPPPPVSVLPGGRSQKSRDENILSKFIHSRIDFSIHSRIVQSIDTPTAMENEMSAAEMKALTDAAAAAGDVVPQFDFTTVAAPASLG